MFYLVYAKSEAHIDGFSKRPLKKLIENPNIYSAFED